jgi:hypothetical protein
MSQSIVIGGYADSTAVNQARFGSTSAPILEFQVGVQNNGATLSIRSSAQLVAATSGATATTTGGLIPAGASVLSVSARVVSAVTTTGAATLDVGDSTDPDRYAAALSGVLATTLTAANYSADPSGVWSSSARELILAAPGGQTFTGTGSVRVVVHYTLPTAPTS